MHLSLFYHTPLPLMLLLLFLQSSKYCRGISDSDITIKKWQLQTAAHTVVSFYRTFCWTIYWTVINIEWFSFTLTVCDCTETKKNEETIENTHTHTSHTRSAVVFNTHTFQLNRKRIFKFQFSFSVFEPNKKANWMRIVVKWREKRVYRVCLVIFIVLVYYFGLEINCSFEDERAWLSLKIDTIFIINKANKLHIITTQTKNNSSHKSKQTSVKANLDQ